VRDKIEKATFKKKIGGKKGTISEGGGNHDGGKINSPQQKY